MERRAPYFFESTFARMTEHDQKEVHLPETIQRELLEPGTENRVLGDVLLDLRVHNVPEPIVQRYAAAVEALLKDRPSIVGRSYAEMGFSPRERYFGPDLMFPEGTTEMLAALPSTFKPRIGSSSEMTRATIDGYAVIRAIQQHTNDLAKTDKEALDAWENRTGGFGVEGDRRPERSRSSVGAYEVFLARLNRLQYAFHEPIHITQSILAGDYLNRLREDLDPDGVLFDELKSSDYIEDFAAPNISTTINELIHHYPALPYAYEIQPTSSGQDVINALITSNEATMDVIAERHTRDVLRNQPALCLWLHNQFVSLYSAGTTWLEQLGSSDALEFKSPDKQVGSRIRDILGIVAQSYFTAFDSTEDAENYFQSHRTTTDGRSVSGAVAEIQPISRTDFLNKLEELRLPTRYTSEQSPAPSVDSYSYPSGETWKYEQRRITLREKEVTLCPPLSRRGLEEGTELYIAGITRGTNPETLFDLFVTLQAALESKQEDLINEARESLEQQTGRPISEELVEELFGFGSYVAVTGLNEAYPRALVVRKAILDRLSERSPQLVESVYKNLFFDASATSTYQEQLGLLGFVSIKGTPDRNDSGATVHQASWDEIAASKTLSIYGIDMTSLPQDEVETVRVLYERVRAGDANDHALFRDAMKTLGDIKRKHLKS